MKATATAATLARKTARGFRTVGNVVSFTPGDPGREEVDITTGRHPAVVPGLLAMSIELEITASLRRPFASPGTWSLRFPGREYLFDARPVSVSWDETGGPKRVRLFVSSPVRVPSRARARAYPRWGGRS